jgi:hypothetical protein
MVGQSAPVPILRLFEDLHLLRLVKKNVLAGDLLRVAFHRNFQGASSAFHESPSRWAPMNRSNKLTVPSLAAVVLIFLCTCGAWMILGQNLLTRTGSSDSTLEQSVAQAWGGRLDQMHPCAWYSPADGAQPVSILPSASDVSVRLAYDPKRKGLLSYRTYGVDFDGAYQITNPAPVDQMIHVEVRLPEKTGSFYNVVFNLDGKETDTPPDGGVLRQSAMVPAGSSVSLKFSYKARGMDRWTYQFADAGRIRNFHLTMDTNFHRIDFPADTGSPTSRKRGGDGWKLDWDYPDVIGAQAIGMAMPSMLNPGPVAARISFFAPVSLLFFFTVLLIFGAVRNANLHPMNYFFLAAGFFAFQLLFAYLVDVLPVYVSFLISALVSLLLVSGYVHALAGRTLSFISIPAQFAYMVLFSYSFFFDGLSGLTVAIGAVATLAILMITTVKIDWEEKFARKAKVAVSPIPAQ